MFVCVGEQYALSLSADPLNTDGYLTALTDAGSGQSVVPNPAALTPPSSPDAPVPLGWNDTRVFNVSVLNGPFSQGSACYGVVYVLGCSGMETYVSTAVPFLLDVSPPTFDFLPGRSGTPLYLEARAGLFYATWLK